MHTTSLRTFLSIIECGSLVGASKKLCVTQSTVTTRLRALETEIGQPLMLRQKSGITLTPAGIKLRRYAEVMLDLWWQMQQETALPARSDAICHIACKVDLWEGLGEVFFDQLHANHPNTALSAWPGSHPSIEQWLGNGLIDVAFSDHASTQKGIQSTKLCDDTLILVGSEATRPQKFDPGYIYVDAGEEFGRSHTFAYTDAGIAKISFGSSRWALSYFCKNGGSAYLPLRLVRDLLEAGSLHRLPDAPPLARAIYFLCSDKVAREWPWLIEMAQSIAAQNNAED